MELVHGTTKASKFASKDIISSMPENIITDILDRLPIQDVVKTSILSRKWRFRWTMVTRLVFDFKFFEYLLRTKGEHLFYRRIISTILLHLKGFITKFVLYVPKEEYNVLDLEDINHWILFLSTKRMQEFIRINMRQTPLQLPTHLCSCLQLKHLMLRNCCFPPVFGFHGFPNLLSFDVDLVRFESCKFGEFITQCPSIEILKFNHHNWNGKVKPFEIAKLENLKMLSLSLCKLDNIVITSSGIFELMGFLPKLQELDLDFQKGKFLGEAGPRKRVPAATLRCLKTLALYEIDFNNRSMALCTCDLIRGSPNMQILKITATHEDRVAPPALFSYEVDCSVMGKLQLRMVELEYIRGLTIELCLIKSLLAYSPSLKKMVIKQKTFRGYAGCQLNYTLARKLLKLHRASPIAEIDLC